MDIGATKRTKRRGPLLWTGDLARRRPALAILLAMLLAVLALLSVGFTVQLQRIRQARMAEERARAVLRQLRQQVQQQQQKPPPDTDDAAGVP
jgi:hypothetical protein